MARIRGDAEDFPAYNAGKNGRPNGSTSPAAAALLFGIDGVELDSRPEAAAMPTPRLAGTVAVNPVLQLIGQANDLLRLAAKLESEGVVALNEGRPRRSLRAGAHLRGESDDLRWLDQARQAYRTRRIRGTIFGDDALFGEPAWDLLLDLFIAAKEGKRVPVTSACIGAAVPTTTALRWLTILEERGLIVREGDPADARRVFVRLSADAYARMIAYFARSAGSEADGTPAGETPCGGDGSAT